MSKIRTFNFGHDSLKDNLELTIEYVSPETESGRYDKRKRGNFFIRVPTEYLELWNTTQGLKFLESWSNRNVDYIAATGKNESDAIKAFTSYMDLYLKAKSKTEIVILYRFEYKSQSIGSAEDHYREQDAVSIEFDFQVCVKKTVGPKALYFKRGAGKNDEPLTEETNIKTGGYQDWVEIPHTVDAEAFFTELYQAMEKLCTKFTEFMGTRNAVLKTLESKTKLLS